MAGTRPRRGTVTAITGAERTLGAAVDAFLAQPRPATTARTYTRTLERLAGELGRDRLLADVTDEDLDGAASRLWAGLHRAPGTGTWPLSARCWPGAAATAGPPGTCSCAPTAAPRRWTTPGRSRCPSWNACGPGPTSRCGNGRCGGCCMTPPAAPRRPSA